MLGYDLVALAQTFIDQTRVATQTPTDSREPCLSPSVAPTLRYDQWCFYASHNSYASRDIYKIQAQHAHNIVQQFELDGIRCFDLDLFSGQTCETSPQHTCQPIVTDVEVCFDKPATTCQPTQEIYCNHHSPDVDALLRTDLTKMKSTVAARSLLSILQDIRDLLVRYPHEVVTIRFENYINPVSLVDDVFDQAGLSDMILKPAWPLSPTTATTTTSPMTTNPLLPTFQWMFDNNRRLVVFTDTRGDSKYQWYQYDWMVETQYGELDPVRIAVQRSASAQSKVAASVRPLFTINNFPDFVFDTRSTNVGQLLASIRDWNNFGWINSPTNIQSIIKTCQTRGVVPITKNPNYILTDWSEQGAVINVVNALNRDTIKKLT